ncbi:MAG: flagellar basal body rod protein FlgB [Myxococcales bacterium]|nr:flagellar basal body rod protein FlgB [Myxococcales bacterium]
MKLESEGVQALVAAMRFRTARQGVLAANVANADTPRYRPVDLEFETALGHEQLRLSGTDARHLPAGDGAHGRSYRVEVGPKGSGPDGNGVSLDDELVRMSRNAGAYQDQADILSRLMGLVRSAISGEG